MRGAERAPDSRPDARNCPTGIARDRRAARLAEIVAVTAATEMMRPDVAAMASTPGMWATCKGMSSAEAPVEELRDQQQTYHRDEVRIAEDGPEGQSRVTLRRAPGHPGRPSVKSAVSTISASTHMAAVTKKA